jgi:preprotein translocase subunit SecF
MTSLTSTTSANRFLRFYRGETHIDFANRWKRWFAMSGIVIIVGLGALGIRGLNFSIDFKGGTVWEVPTTASVSTVRAALIKVSPTMSQAVITTLTNRETGKVNIQVQSSAKTTSDATLTGDVTKALAGIAHTSTDNVTENAIGPSWGSDISHKAAEAVIVFLVLISIYIWIRFEGKMAIAALVALLHDILVTVGIYALSGFQVSPDTVIAFLTILGYSLYDTIVVFDKVQENTRNLASTSRETYTDMVNLSMNQVMARSVNTSLVAILPILSILVLGSWILGASALNDFGLALLIGLTSGAYSSIFIASPLLAILKEREPRYAQIRERLAQYGGAAKRPVLTPASAAAAAGGDRSALAAGSGRRSLGPALAQEGPEPSDEEWDDEGVVGGLEDGDRPTSGASLGGGTRPGLTRTTPPRPRKKTPRKR